MIPLQAMYMLTLSSYLEERAAKVHRKALGRIQVALAGAPPSSFYTTVDKFFGYQEEEEEEGGDGDEKADEGAAGEEVIYSQKGSPRSAATSALPPHLRSVRGRTQTVVSQASGTDTDKESTKQHINPAITKAVILKPGPIERSWSRTGLAKEFQPTNEGGRYGCPMCPKYEPRSNIDTVATHIRRDHLNIALGCHFCEDAFFSSEGWKKHNTQKHGKTNRNEFILEDAAEPGTYVPPSPVAMPTDLILAEVKEEEKTAIEQAAGISSGVDLDVEPGFTEEIMEV